MILYSGGMPSGPGLNLINKNPMKLKFRLKEDEIGLKNIILHKNLPLHHVPSFYNKNMPENKSMEHRSKHGWNLEACSLTIGQAEKKMKEKRRKQS